jgi:hypothetical protein
MEEGENASGGLPRWEWQVGDNVRAAEIFRHLVVGLWVRNCLMHSHWYLLTARQGCELCRGQESIYIYILSVCCDPNQLGHRDTPTFENVGCCPGYLFSYGVLYSVRCHSLPCTFWWAIGLPSMHFKYSHYACPRSLVPAFSNFEIIVTTQRGPRKSWMHSPWPLFRAGQVLHCEAQYLCWSHVTCAALSISIWSAHCLTSPNSRHSFSDKRKVFRRRTIGRCPAYGGLPWQLHTERLVILTSYSYR